MSRNNRDNKPDNGEQFGILANYYDVLNYNANYKKVADYIETVFNMYQKKPNLVLDLACGTGNLTLELSKRGYDMTGVDLSADMLSVASLKSKKNNILWLNQDMRSFELYGTVDAVICCFDSLNYILDDDGIEKCFSLVNNYLDPGGLFIFDVNSKYKFESIYANNNFVLEKKDVFCSWQNYYSKKNKTCDFYITLFAKQFDGKHKRYNETQKEKYHSEKFLKTCLINAGFEDIRLFCDFNADKNFNPNEKHGRMCFSAVKKIMD